MDRLTDTKSTSFRWTKSGKLASSLTSEGGVYATIVWAKRWGTLVTAESADGKWTLKRAGFLRPRITIRQSGSEADLAVVNMDWSGGGTVNFSDGPTFQLIRAGFWKPEWVLLDATRKRIMTLKPSLGGRNAGASMEIESGSVRSNWRISLLAIIARYLSILVSQYDYADGASAAAVMAATGY